MRRCRSWCSSRPPGRSICSPSARSPPAISAPTWCRSSAASMSPPRCSPRQPWRSPGSSASWGWSCRTRCAPSGATVTGRSCPRPSSGAARCSRYPRLSLWGAERAQDRSAVERALGRCDVAGLADRWLWTLSGGEYQRVRVARALAQEPQLLVLDEPTASLDVRHEMELFELARTVVDEQGLAVVMITHHINLAARFADRVLLLSEGRAVGQGAPGEVLTRETVARVFAWPVAIEAFDGRPQVVPLRRRRNA